MHATGGADRLRLERVPTPAPGPGEALVRVIAGSLSAEDVAVRSGRRAIGKSLPHRLGREVSGEVVAVGEGVEGWRPGDKIVAAPEGLGESRDGSYSDFVTVPASALVKLPRGIPAIEAVAALRAFGALWTAVVEKAAVPEGQFALVLGAQGTGAIAATQLLNWAGARVICLAEGRPADELRRLGAEFVLDASAPQLEERIEAATGGAGVSVAIDTAGPSAWSLALDLLSPGGKLVVPEQPGAPSATLDPARLTAKSLLVMGCRSTVQTDAISRLLSLCTEGLLEVPIDGFLPLHEARWGHERIEREPRALPMVLVPA